VNEYFARHPQMMLGKMKLEGTMYRGGEPALVGELTPDLLRRAIEALPKARTYPQTAKALPAHHPAEAFDGVKQGAFAERVASSSSAMATILNPPISLLLRRPGARMMAVRDAVRFVFKTQLDDARA